MVARTPPKTQQKKMVVAPPLNPALLCDAVKKVDKCMARLQELQYTVSGGAKKVSGVTLSPRSTRIYLKTSLRCKQETLRIKHTDTRKSSPTGKLPSHLAGEWRRMSLPAMLLGETMTEIIQATQFARDMVGAASSDDPKTPTSERRSQKRTPENSELRARRKREKQSGLEPIRSESDPPSRVRRNRSRRINFKVSPPQRKRDIERENAKYSANRISPKNRPWARKTVLFPNPVFHSSPDLEHRRTKSPAIDENRQRTTTTPHKFIIKSTNSSSSKFQLKIRSPPLSISPTRVGRTPSKRSPPKLSAAARLRRSLSPSRLANRLVSPLKGRKSAQKKSEGATVAMMTTSATMMKVMRGLKQRPAAAVANSAARTTTVPTISDRRSR